MIKYTITSGTPTKEELRALEIALTHRKKVATEDVKIIFKSEWAKPILRTSRDRKN